jgi:hypothetical protein
MAPELDAETDRQLRSDVDQDSVYTTCHLYYRAIVTN